MSEIAPSTLPAPAVTPLKVVTLIFLVGLAGIWIYNLATNMGPLLYYVHLLNQGHHRVSTVIAFAYPSLMVVSAVAMLAAAALMFMPRWNFSGIAQACAIINAFGIIALWGLNAYVMAQHLQPTDESGNDQLALIPPPDKPAIHAEPLPTVPLLQAGGLLVANILTACMLNGVMRQRKQNPATPPE